jgi:hypothetical protein
MKEIPSEEMSMLQGGFAPLAPDPPLNRSSVNLETVMRALMNLWPNPLIADHKGCAN